MRKTLALLILAAVAATPLAAAAAEGYAYADLLSAYVYNGQVGNEEPVFQPGLDVTGPLGLGFSLWANMNLTDADENACPWYPDTQGKWSELNLGVNWTVPWEGPLSFTLGYTYYVFPQDSSSVDENADGSLTVSRAPADGGYEAYVKVTAEDVLLTPGIKFAHNMDDGDDWFTLFTIGHSFELTDALSLDLGGTLGYAGDYYVESNLGSDAGATFTHAQVDAALNFALNEQASIGLKAAYSSILDSDVRDDIKADEVFPEVDILYGGVTASYSF